MNLEAKKTVLRKLPHGVYIIGVKDGAHINAFTGTWLTQVSFTPPLVALGVKKDAHSYPMITEGRVFSVNLLGKQQKPIAEHFVKPAAAGTDKFAGIKYRLGATGAPILEDAIGFIECKVTEIANQHGDHAIVIGEVIEAGVHTDGPALTLLDTGWHYGG